VHEAVSRFLKVGTFRTGICTLRIIGRCICLRCEVDEPEFRYSVWAGVGVLAVGAIGILYFKEPVSVPKIASIVLISAGVVLFHLSESTQ
jgi:multidrug transporter EmrE-like cation transporter